MSNLKEKHFYKLTLVLYTRSKHTVHTGLATNQPYTSRFIGDSIVKTNPATGFTAPSHP